MSFSVPFIALVPIGGWVLAVALAANLGFTCAAIAGGREADRIQPWKEDPRYWQYRGEPILLIGASDQDNLFNHPDLPPDGLAAHLDRLVAVGGNYVRNTISCRDQEESAWLRFRGQLGAVLPSSPESEGGNVWPFHRDEQSGLYDLNRFNDEFWNRLRTFLDLTAERGIVVQIELWDRFDYARDPWDRNPFNPKNNLNYTSEQSGLPEQIDTHPGQRANPFFRSLPNLENNELLLPFQEKLIRKILEVSLPYDHVLYCISNESSDSEEWSAYWADLLQAEADMRGLGIEITEMWDSWELHHPMHQRTFDRPDRYSFVDVSQNSHQIGQAQWDNLQWARRVAADPPRPVNNVKMYGGDHGGGPEEGQHKLWRNILGGAASARYHRPGGGIGLNEVAAAHLASMNLMLKHVDMMAAEPMLELLHEREEDEAYLAAIPGLQYALYFPNGGSVQLDLAEADGDFHLHWINVLEARWESHWRVTGGRRVGLHPPGDGPWAALLLRP